MTTNVLLCGVGGQGIITASAVLAEAALLSGCDVKKSEVHGMSQRGGSVESHVRFSRDGGVYSPLIPAGGADLLLAFEVLEALRKLPMVGPGGTVLTDGREIVPISVTCGPFEYPAEPLNQLLASGRAVHAVGAFETACELGEPRAANMVMLGAASCFLDIAPGAWEEAIRGCVPAKAVAVNVRAFEAGSEALSAR
jgi:indolepyruvate ferredoxin oxidoreductase beta subunit